MTELCFDNCYLLVQILEAKWKDSAGRIVLPGQSFRSIVFACVYVYLEINCAFKGHLSKFA